VRVVSIDRAPTKLLGALTVTAAAALLAGPAAASTPMPPPVASWHGHPIRQPEPRPNAPTMNGLAREGGAKAALGPGTGYGRPGGSTRVRAVQRMLHRLGYQCGPVDGLYGPLTAASVRWFQIKHGFPPTGVADAGTLGFLTFRATGRAPKAATPAQAAPAPAKASPAATPARASAPAVAPHPGHGWSALVFVLLAIGLALVLVGLGGWTLRRRRSDSPEPPEADTPPPPPAPRALPAPQAPPEPDRPIAVGYAVAGSKRDLDRQTAAIEEACAEREWALAGIVREAAGGSRPELTHALEQAAGKTEARLVVALLDRVAPSPAQLAILLAACARHGVDLAAVDPDLDTGTPEGRLAARSLLGSSTPVPVARWPRRRRTAPTPTVEAGR
jgi:Putative peptidoglycan binding domain/Resolvase, N terminal domain